MKTITIKNKSFNQNKPLVCISLMGKDKTEVLDTLHKMNTYNYDVLEWRIDHLEDCSIENVLDVSNCIQQSDHKHILLYTFRSKNEGGEKAIAFEEYLTLNKALIENKCCDIVDVEVFMDDSITKSLCEVAHKKGMYVIGSYHDFHKTPGYDEILKCFLYMQECDVDLCKIALMPKDKEDVTTLMKATKEMYDMYANRPLVSISMSDLGKISRIAGEVFGSSMTFACIGKVSAPGQIEVNELHVLLKDPQKSINEFIREKEHN